MALEDAVTLAACLRRAEGRAGVPRGARRVRGAPPGAHRRDARRGADQLRHVQRARSGAERTLATAGCAASSSSTPTASRRSGGSTATMRSPPRTAPVALRRQRPPRAARAGAARIRALARGADASRIARACGSASARATSASSRARARRRRASPSSGCTPDPCEMLRVLPPGAADGPDRAAPARRRVHDGFRARRRRARRTARGCGRRLGARAGLPPGARARPPGRASTTRSASRPAAAPAATWPPRSCSSGQRAGGRPPASAWPPRCATPPSRGRRHFTLSRRSATSRLAQRARTPSPANDPWLGRDRLRILAASYIHGPGPRPDPAISPLRRRPARPTAAARPGRRAGGAARRRDRPRRGRDVRPA